MANDDETHDDPVTPPRRRFSHPVWGIVLGLAVALAIGGIAVAVLDDGGDTSDHALNARVESNAPTTAPAATSTPTAASPVGTDAAASEGIQPTAATTAPATTQAVTPVVGLPPVVSETGHHFGMVAVGSTSAEWLVVISNPNTEPLEISLAGGAAHDPFDGSSLTCGGNTTVLPGGGSCHIGYVFKPTAVGSVAGDTGITITVVSTGVSTRYTITYAGIGS